MVYIKVRVWYIVSVVLVWVEFDDNYVILDGIWLLIIVIS